MVSDGSQTLPLSPTERLDRRPEKEFGVAFTHVDKRSTDTSKLRVTTIGCTCEISPAGTLPCSFMAVLTKATSETCRMGLVVNFGFTNNTHTPGIAVRTPAALDE
ncbi:hypothetical protein IAS59_001568 [Cryptococcus gattii]